MTVDDYVATPADKPLRLIAGAFYQRQSNNILQEYHVDNLAASLSVNGRPGLLWLTKQKRIDRDYAVFGELSFDVTPQITLTGGGRLYKYDNSLVGFFGYSDGYSGSTGVAACFGSSLPQPYRASTAAARVLHRPSFFPTPAAPVRLLLGEGRNVGKVVLFPS